MRPLLLPAAALLSMTAIAALAQAPGLDPATGARAGHEPGTGISLPFSKNASNIEPGDTHSLIAPTLPPSSAGANATVHEYLTAARAALVAGRTGEAQQSLEMAETRALDRSVVADQADEPSRSRFVARISDARHSLGNGDTARTLALIDLALAG